MNTSEEIKQKIWVSFEHILDNCKTIGDLQKLHNQVLKLKEEQDENSTRNN